VHFFLVIFFAFLLISLVVFVNFSGFLGHFVGIFY